VEKKNCHSNAKQNEGAKFIVGTVLKPTKTMSEGRQTRTQMGQPAYARKKKGREVQGCLSINTVGRKKNLLKGKGRDGIWHL